MEYQKKHLQPPRLEKPIRITEQVWPKGTLPVVSVFCITYNHEKFIREAIEGFLMQETTFPVEIFIHDDASTDSTAKIVTEYSERYPNLFWPVLQTENQWSKGNRIFLIDYLIKQRGEFIALCEGDDYWTNAFKLLYQINHLEKNKDLSGVFHRSYAVDKKKQKIPFLWDKISYKTEYNQKECIFNLLSAYPTASLVFRKYAYPELKKLPFFYVKNPCDFNLDIMLTESGKLGFLNFEGSAYRQHASGIWSNISKKARQKETLTRYINLYKTPQIKKKYPEIKSSVENELLGWWWKNFNPSFFGWFSATFECLKVLLQNSVCFSFIWWFLNKKSPVRSELKNIIIK